MCLRWEGVVDAAARWTKSRAQEGEGEHVKSEEIGRTLSALGSQVEANVNRVSAATQPLARWAMATGGTRIHSPLAYCRGCRRRQHERLVAARLTAGTACITAALGPVSGATRIWSVEQVPAKATH